MIEVIVAGLKASIMDSVDFAADLPIGQSSCVAMICD